MAPYMTTKRNRDKVYPIVIQTRVADHHVAVIKAYMNKYDVTKAEAVRMAIEAAALYLLTEDD